MPGVALVVDEVSCAATPWVVTEDTLRLGGAPVASGSFGGGPGQAASGFTNRTLKLAVSFASTLEALFFYHELLDLRVDLSPVPA